MLTAHAIVTPKELAATLSDAFTWAEEIRMAYAWASSSNGRAEHWRLLPLRKLKQVVIGLHFAQTEPFVLKALRSLGVLRVARDTAGVFHPKVFVAVSGDIARVIVGSSNFTTGGFSTNTEANVMLVGPRADPAIEKLISFVDLVWHEAAEPNDELMKEYGELYDRRPSPPAGPNVKRPDEPATLPHSEEPRLAPVMPTASEGKPVANSWKEFHDTADRIDHDAFMAWKAHHPDGYDLAVKTTDRANLHQTQCHHVGTLPHHTYGGSATKDRKVCSDDVDDLFAWADANRMVVKACGTCRTKLRQKGSLGEPTP